MKKIFCFVLCACVIACSGEETKKAPSRKELKADIVRINDSLYTAYRLMMEQSGAKFPAALLDSAIKLNLQYYRSYPKDSYAPECLDRVQQLYLQQKNYSFSLRYTDSLLIRYPKYGKRASLLLNAGSTGEIIQDTILIRKYYTQLLQEFPKLDPETREMVEFRLAHLDLRFDELIDLQIEKERAAVQ